LKISGRKIANGNQLQELPMAVMFFAIKEFYQLTNHLNKLSE
jgi:hypothetical protein